MPNTLKQLKAIWNKEKKCYQFQEIGSGVQSFVREMLRSPDLFNLGVCPLSKKPETRKMEFIHEKKTKDGRQADFVIYIDQDIVIPVEVESFGKIESGVKQLANYQQDLEKKYGILTDGNTWRFYTDNVYRKFSLTEIFKNSALFLEYWKEYIKPETYYLQFFEDTGQLSIFSKDELFVEHNRPLFFDNITQLITKLKIKLGLEGYFNGVSKKEKDKKATEITYAYIIQFILYKTLVDNDFGNFGKEYEEKGQLIHKFLRELKYKDILGIIDDISEKISTNVYRPFAKEQEIIHEKLWKLFHQPEDKLSDVSPWLDIFVFIKKFNFQNVRNEIFGFIYENYLKELFEDTKKGQYFTDPAVVNFMINQIGYCSKDLKAKIKKGQLNKLSIIDPSCGSGTFLYSAVDGIIEAVPNGSQKSSEIIEEIVTSNIFGVDIEEFPLYLAEMNIIMRMLPLIISEEYNNPIDKKIKVFKTRDSIAEFIHAGLDNTSSDIDVAGGQQYIFPTKDLYLGYDSYVRDEEDLEEMKQSMAPPRRRFDFVIGNPPYVSYNECSKQGLLIFQLLKQQKARLNNIYGVNLHSAPKRPKKYRPNPNLYAFFIALGLALLKDNGKLCYIIPQTILTAGDLDVIRFHLAKFTTIEKIIIFSGRMFIGRGMRRKKSIPTSSLIVVITRKMPNPEHQLEIENYKESNDRIEETFDNILKGNKVDRKQIKQTDLLFNYDNWNFIKHDKALLALFMEIRKNTDDISFYYEHTLANARFKSRFYFDSGYSIDEKKLLKERPKGEFYLYPRLKNNLWMISENRGFWPNIRTGKSLLRIKLRQANQKFNLLDSKHKIIWSYANPKKFHFSSLPLIWARNQFCAIGSDNKTELLYLFALLNSPIIKLILESNLKSETEKDLLISTTSVKQFVDVPKITEENQSIKKEIIDQTERMLKLEQVTLSDLVDFRKVMIQKFDDIETEENVLALIKGDNKIKLEITRNDDLVKRAIGNLTNKDNLVFEKKKIILNELKKLPVIDFELRNKIKDYIDDLVFTLYFNVPLKKIGFNWSKNIKSDSRKNKFYSILEKHNI